jgi:hypothetical protein
MHRTRNWSENAVTCFVLWQGLENAMIDTTIPTNGAPTTSAYSRAGKMWNETIKQ